MAEDVQDPAFHRVTHHVLPPAGLLVDYLPVQAQDVDEQAFGQPCAVKVACVNAALYATSEIFDLTGARGTSAKYGFDRFWRNARTLSTHDPTDAKEVWIGDWYLSGKAPPHVAMIRV